MLSNSNRTKIKKGAHKAVFDKGSLYQIIDESLIAHIAIVEESGPVVIPMLAWRVGDAVYIHGANNSRLMKQLNSGRQTCLTFTLFDGWILARSAFHHSASYRSAVVFGAFESIEDAKEKDSLLNYFIEHIAPGRTQHIRLSSDKELAATMVLRLPLAEASVKISQAKVNDDQADLALAAWAGYLPYKTKVGPLQATEDLVETIPTPDYSMAYGERWQQ